METSPAPSPAERPSSSAASWQARLPHLSETHRNSLRSAAESLDLDAAEKTLASIEPDDPELARELRALVQSYRFDTLSELLSR